VFPEGTFTAQDGVRPFHLGAFKAAAATGSANCAGGRCAGTRRFLRERDVPAAADQRHADGLPGDGASSGWASVMAGSG